MPLSGDAYVPMPAVRVTHLLAKITLLLQRVSIGPTSPPQDNSTLRTQQAVAGMRACTAGRDGVKEVQGAGEELGGACQEGGATEDRAPVGGGKRPNESTGAGESSSKIRKTTAADRQLGFANPGVKMAAAAPSRRKVSVHTSPPKIATPLLIRPINQ
jgi:hypothetical protein